MLGEAEEPGSSCHSVSPDVECSLRPEIDNEQGDDHMGGDEITNTPTCSFVDETEELKKTIDCQVKIIEDLQQTVQNLTMIRPLPFSEQTFKSDECVNFYTGLPNLIILKTVFEHVMPAISLSESSKLMPFQEYVAVLIRLGGIPVFSGYRDCFRLPRYNIALLNYRNTAPSAPHVLIFWRTELSSNG